MRTVIYARYSSQLQNSRSIEDQIAACRERADREGWPIVEIFTDYAISGAAGMTEAQRPGFNAMLERLEAANHPGGRVDQVLTDSTSRYSRNEADGAYFRELLTHWGVRLFTLSSGEIDPIKGAITGLLDAQQRRELAHNIKRGQRGTVKEGRAPAGLAYGYRTANRMDDRGRPVRGLRAIDPDQAEIVVRIFTEFAAGLSTRAIAERLNADGIKGPTGGKWRASTIHGDRKRQNGMLQNRLYAGVLVHNRTSKVVDPRSRKTIIRPNPESDWVTEPVPALRIVDEATWKKVQAKRRAHDGERIDLRRRPRHMLSGLMFCGLCGGGWTVAGKDYWGCGRHRDGRGCANNRTIRRDTLERRVIDGLRGQLLHPDVVSAYLKEYHEDFARRSRALRASRDRLDRKLREAETRIGRLVEAIARGADIDEVKAALAGARADRAAATADLADLEAVPVIALHPGLAREYRDQVEQLTESLDGTDAARLEVIPKIRALIEAVYFTPATDARGCEIKIQGRLAALLALATGAPLPEECSVMGERVKGLGHYRTLSSGNG